MIVGCDIHLRAERLEDGQWIEVVGSFTNGPVPFDWRSYAMFGFLADVRNYSAITPISKPRGLPQDIHKPISEGWGSYLDDYDDRFGEHSFSWLTVEELTAYDYDQIIEDRRCSRQISPNLVSGGQTCDPGDGEKMSLREFLGDAFFHDLKVLQGIRAERIVFGFDN